MPKKKTLSAKPTQPPAFDASTTWKVLDTELRKGEPFVEIEGVKTTVQQTGGPYAVFQDNAFPRWKRWVDGSAEFDGSGLRDTVDANAQYLDEVKGDLDRHRDADNARHATLTQRVAALEAQSSSSPFPE